MTISTFSQKHAEYPYTYHYADSDSNLDLKQIISLPKSDWIKINMKNFGHRAEPHWFKFTIDTALHAENRWIQLNYALLDNVQLWFLSGDQSDSTVLTNYTAGDQFEYDHRPFNFETFLFPVPDYDDTLTVIMRVQSSGNLKVPIRLWQEQKLIEYSGLVKIFLACFIGFMSAMVVCNLLIYASTGQTLFVQYSCYVISITLLLTSLQGTALRYFWPNSVFIQFLATPLFVSLTLIFIISLAIRLLNLTERMPFAFKVLSILRLLFVFTPFLLIILPYSRVVLICVMVMFISNVCMLGCGLYLLLKGDKVAKYFCAAWSMLILSGLWVALEQFSLVVTRIDPSFLVIMATIAETTLLAYALSLKYTEQIKQNNLAAIQAIETEQKALAAHDTLIKEEAHQNKIIEQSILARKQEIKIALEQLQIKNKQLEEISAIDPLTGLYNRCFFERRLLEKIQNSRQERKPLGLVILDIDFFKSINDNYGHICGDRCLVSIASTLKQQFSKPNDLICRYGGEEFVLILPDTDYKVTKTLTERLRVLIQDSVLVFEDKSVTFTVSVGATSRTFVSDDEMSLAIPFIDKLLYQAKQSGRNKVVMEYL